ncbi:MAG: late competence development ComFB family protein [Bacillota bacterium]
MTNKNFQKLQEDLHNHTEDLVLDQLENILSKEKFSNVCQCEQCLLDMASYTLNRIPAKYIASHSGGIHAKLAEFEQQYIVDITSTITQAIKIVSKNPRHD